MTLGADSSPTSESTATPESAEPPNDDGWQRLNPQLAIFTQLDDLNVRLAQLLARTPPLPSGGLVPLSGQQVGGTPVNTLSFVDEPLFGFTLTNDGPGVLQYDVGERQQWCVLRNLETIHIDMRAPIIPRIRLLCDPGQTAAWRLTGVR